MISNSYLICESENLLKVYHKIQMHQSNAAPLMGLSVILMVNKIDSCLMVANFQCQGLPDRLLWMCDLSSLHRKKCSGRVSRIWPPKSHPCTSGWPHRPIRTRYWLLGLSLPTRHPHLCQAPWSRELGEWVPLCSLQEKPSQRWSSDVILSYDPFPTPRWPYPDQLFSIPGLHPPPLPLVWFLLMRLEFLSFSPLHLPD